VIVSQNCLPKWPKKLNFHVEDQDIVPTYLNFFGKKIVVKKEKGGKGEREVKKK
jgi:hypothetical protein